MRRGHLGQNTFCLRRVEHRAFEKMLQLQKVIWAQPLLNAEKTRIL